ncbi:ATP-binding protein [Streptomyces sp. NPDC019443]|uniref:ATP-binding protein n=1 Tax=Streptomyces sp. NPDC019443 TaxID=3365061 RepID=UPI00379CE283
MTGRQGGAGPAASGHGRKPGAEGDPGGGRLRRRLGCADLTAVPEVRRALRELLRHWGKQDTAEVAELLASELVTNALVHTDHGAVVTATVAASTLRVEVRDFMAGLPVPDVPAAAHLGTHGRGLVLVQSLADAWGVRTHGVGKVVWFELRERPA